MKYILCYGDSNTWGCVPVTMKRYDYAVRWPGVMASLLGPECHVYENALNGRTTVWDDPVEEGRCGKAGFPVVLESCAPLDLVILMLGTNDCKKRFNLDPWDIGWGMDLLVQYVRRSGCGADGACPRILIAAPPAFGDMWDETILGTVFGPDANRRGDRLPAIYREIAERNGVDFFDASAHARGEGDCVHLLPESHRKLGAAFATKVGGMLGLTVTIS